MSKFVIHAYESIYGGLHGMDKWFIEEGRHESDVYSDADEASRDVIRFYDCIFDKLLDRAENNASYIDYDDVRDAILCRLEDEIDNDIAYDVWELNDAGYVLYNTMSEAEVDTKLYNEQEEFVAQYCVKG